MKKNLPRFLYGFLSSSVEPINISIPWRPSDRDGLFKMNRTPEIAERDNLLMWAHTNKGERVYDFEFGLDAHRYLFEPSSKAKEVLLNNARNQLKKYFSYLLIEQLQILSPDDDNSLPANSLRLILIARLRKDGNVIEIDEVLS
jgi:hypothetical protein